jgi:predicted GNAT superfamily acetyltransferase
MPEGIRRRRRRESSAFVPHGGIVVGCIKAGWKAVGMEVGWTGLLYVPRSFREYVDAVRQSIGKEFGMRLLVPKDGIKT